MTDTLCDHMHNAYLGITKCFEDSANFVLECPPVKGTLTFGENRYTDFTETTKSVAKYVAGVDGLKQVAILLSSASKLARIVNDQGLLPVHCPFFPVLEEHMDTFCKVTSIKSFIGKANGFISGESFEHGLSWSLLSKTMLIAYDILGVAFLAERCGLITQECAKLPLFKLPNNYDFNLKDAQAALGAGGWALHGAIIAAKICTADSSRSDEWKNEQYLTLASDFVRSLAIGLVTQKDNYLLVGAQLAASCVGFGLAYAAFNMQTNN